MAVSSRSDDGQQSEAQALNIDLMNARRLSK